jgi:hypothetical protein
MVPFLEAAVKRLLRFALFKASSFAAFVTATRLNCQTVSLTPAAAAATTAACQAVVAFAASGRNVQISVTASRILARCFWTSASS